MVYFINHNINDDFKNHLNLIWLEIIRLVIEKPTADILALKLRKLADNFYDEFKNSLIPITKYSHIYKKFHSVSILFSDGSNMAIPYFFYQQAQYDSPPDFESLFNSEDTWLDLLTNIYEATKAVKSTLINLDIKILRALTYYKRTSLFSSLDIENRSFLFTTSNLSKIVRSSVKWTSKRINYLISNSILMIRYLLNPYIFGFNTYLIIYDQSYDSKLVNLKKFTLFRLKFNNNELVRVFQIPNTYNFDELDSFNFKIYPIRETHIFNNLSGLSTNNDKSFLNVPNFQSKKPLLNRPVIVFKENDVDWLKTLTTIDNSNTDLYYPILARMSIEKRKSTLVNVVNYLAKWGSPQGNLRNVAKSAGTNVAEFMEICRFLFNRDILAFFPTINRIGCNNRFGIFFTSSNQTLFSNFYTNILELPHSISFLGNNSIFTYVTLPDTYSPSFMRYLGMLHNRNDVTIKYGSFISLKSFGRYTLPVPKGTYIDEFGVHFEKNELENLNMIFTE